MIFGMFMLSYLLLFWILRFIKSFLYQKSQTGRCLLLQFLTWWVIFISLCLCFKQGDLWVYSNIEEEPVCIKSTSSFLKICYQFLKSKWCSPTNNDYRSNLLLAFYIHIIKYTLLITYLFYYIVIILQGRPLRMMNIIGNK